MHICADHDSVLKERKTERKSKEQINKVRKREGVVRDLAVVQEILEFRSVDSFTSEQNRQQLDSKKGTSALICRLIFPSASTDFSQTEMRFCFHVPRWGWRSFHPTEVWLCHWNFWYYFCLLSSVSYERLNELLCPFPWSKFDSPQNQHEFYQTSGVQKHSFTISSPSF